MEAFSTTATVAGDGARHSALHPSRTVVLAMIAYLPIAFLATLAAGDLGDIGFWFVWIPVVAVVLYLPVAGVARLLRR